MTPSTGSHATIFSRQLMTDDEFAVFFVGMSDDTVKRVRQEVVEFFCQATGGPSNYTGRDMKTSDAGARDHRRQSARSASFAGSMNKFKVPEDVKADLVMALRSARRIAEIR